MLNIVQAVLTWGNKRIFTEVLDYNIQKFASIRMKIRLVYMLRAIGRSDPSADGRPVGGSTDGFDICAGGGSGPSVDIVSKRRETL